jgi:hypothetical protein
MRPRRTFEPNACDMVGGARARTHQVQQPHRRGRQRPPQFVRAGQNIT